jgi:phenylalanyl-tRNA synthetase alpha chain
MVDPRVFEKVGVDPERYTGFAFGFGLDRIAMLVYGIPDLRQLFAGDQRLTRQFT